MQRARIAGLVAAAFAASAVALVPMTSSASAGVRSVGVSVPSDLRLVATRHSLLGTHQWYAQVSNGVPVLGGYYAIHTDANGVAQVEDGRLAVSGGVASTAAVSSSAAQARAATAVRAASVAGKRGPGAARLALQAPTSTSAALAILPGATSRLVYRVVGHSANGSTQTLVDASSGAVLSATSLTKDATGHGKVFDPNPVVSLRDESLKDMNDSNAAVPAAAYKAKTLTNLLAGTKLTGTFVKIRNTNIATSANLTFNYQRNDDHFEQVEAYYQLTTAQKYIQSLGFTDVNNEAQDVFTDTIRDDNSFYDPSNDTITYGDGGVDDAEDAEVIWHEYGHAIQDDQVPGFGSSEQGGAIGEGFGDYWAVTMSQPVSKGFDLPCVMDWDSTSYTSGPSHCLRRTDTGKTTDDIDGEVHDDGEIWSNALWDINLSLGRSRANKIILESQFSFRPNTSFAQAATVTVNTARALYGNGAATKVKAAFVARKIL
jgi:Zn-dependent metalloprotease